MPRYLEILQASHVLEKQIARYFAALDGAGEGELFQPHPFSSEQASLIANYQGGDCFAFALHEEIIIGYGMLRGWDDGYEIPSLGISIHPEFRGMGVGLLMMHYLHSVAALRNCSRVRLRVNKANHRAIALYEKLGYSFEEYNSQYYIGFVTIRQKLKPANRFGETAKP
jgi:[ribosomal protein S18]-alanine N-acetyltransferase